MVPKLPPHWWPLLTHTCVGHRGCCWLTCQLPPTHNTTNTTQSVWLAKNSALDNTFKSEDRLSLRFDIYIFISPPPLPCTNQHTKVTNQMLIKKNMQKILFFVYIFRISEKFRASNSNMSRYTCSSSFLVLLPEFLDVITYFLPQSHKDRVDFLEWTTPTCIFSSSIHNYNRKTVLCMSFSLVHSRSYHQRKFFIFLSTLGASPLIVVTESCKVERSCKTDQ